MAAQLILFGLISLAFVLIFAFIHALNKINERAAAEHREHCTKLAVEAFEPSDALLRLRALREKQRRARKLRGITIKLERANNGR